MLTNYIELQDINDGDWLLNEKIVCRGQSPNAESHINAFIYEWAMMRYTYPHTMFTYCFSSASIT